MNTRKYIRGALLIVAVGSVLYMAAKEIADRREATANTFSSSSLAAGEGVSQGLVVYYFSEGKLCATCENIENYTREALETYFAGELASGFIAWRPVDVDDPSNEHYVTEYNIYTKSVVLVRIENGKRIRWKNLEAIWDYVYDKPAFVEYIRSQTRDFLDATP